MAQGVWGRRGACVTAELLPEKLILEAVRIIACQADQPMKKYILTAHTRYHLVVAILVQTVFRRVFLQLTVLHMALREAWTRAAEGRMSPSEQCKLWALREVLREQQQSDTQWEWMASRVQVVGGGNPARQSVQEFFQRLDKAGKGWYPGYTGGKRGRKKQMTPGKRSNLAKSMMAGKKRGVNPCYETALVLAPSATLNEETQAPFSRTTINAVLTTDCYDEDPSRPWEFRFGSKRRALTAADKEERRDWAERLLKECRSAAWCCQNLLWVDFCAKVIPGTPVKALDQACTAKNKKKRLMSPGSRNDSANLGGTPLADKQCSVGDTRVYFLVALTRGVLGVHVFDADFPGESPAGAGLLVAALPPLLRKMLGSSDRHPRTIVSDRGPGFYHGRWGTITGDYEHACRVHGFKPWCGTNSKEGPRAQPADVGDVLLHETSVSWLRRAEERCRPKVPW